MIQVNIQKLLDERGKTRYWLAKQAGMSYQNIVKLVNNEAKGIRFETLEILCQVLDCTPNDLFTIDLEKPEGR